jgi:hypothetical protein
MNRGALIVKIGEIKKRAQAKGAKPTHVALCGTALLKLDCTHLHGMQLVRYPGLKRNQAVLFEKAEDGTLRPVQP